MQSDGVPGDGDTLFLDSALAEERRGEVGAVDLETLVAVAALLAQ
ncbi:hypothetical protein ACWDGI_36015 [Streptomyces sp. NPDC001220]